MTINPWHVPITRLRRAHGQRQHETRRGLLGELKVADSCVDAGAEITADVYLDSIDGGIEVSGTITAPWSGECRRCLRPIHDTLEIEVREVYRPRSERERDEDVDTYPLVGEMLDLVPLARDAVLLELPVNPLCRPDCEGLCPRCGTALEEGPCSCPAEGSDPRWGALEGLRQPAAGPTD
jgi:uncharacterized protein